MSKKTKKILADHRQHKTRYIPPLIDGLSKLTGEVKEASWIKHGLPELFWIGLIHHAYGLREGAEIVLKFTMKCSEEHKEDPKPLIASVTSFNHLTLESKEKIKKHICDTGIKDKLLPALGGLLAYYPECSLRFIAEEKEIRKYHTPEHLDVLKMAIEPLFYKLEKEPVFTQAIFIYVAVAQEKIQIASHLPLAKIPEIQKYPDTDLSRQIASGLRATLPLFLDRIMDAENGGHEWANYFWNRGLEIDPCMYGVAE